MITNLTLFNSLVARIGECRKRMTIIRNEIRLHEESGKETVAFKRELLNLNRKISSLQSQLQNFKRMKGYAS
ncbi:MAG: hypothetical protein H6540_03405 [Bacteroidales bacterium]|nr:hypothetical protein [Bacteroidales bacterium]